MQQCSKPLVSIIVITYNSSKYVLETLESAKAQTYQNIELIVSDDGSKDDTLEICKNWLAQNKERFVSTELITVEENTGIPANCNRGVKASKGEWVKLIAGDDILLNGNIENNLTHALQTGYLFVISDMIYFNENKSELAGYGSKNEIINFFSRVSACEKLKSYRRNSVFLNSPTYFYHRSVYNKNKGYDEDFMLLEDNPFIINTLQNKINISFLPKKTVKYRINLTSVTGQGGDIIRKDLRNLYYKYKKAQLSEGTIKDQIFNVLIKFEMFMKRKGIGKSILFKIYRKITSKIRELS